MKILNIAKFSLMLSAIIVSTQNPIFAADDTKTSTGDQVREGIRSVPGAIGRGAVSAGKSVYQGIVQLKSKQDGLNNRLNTIKADTENLVRIIESLKGRTLAEAQINKLKTLKDKIVGNVKELEIKAKDAKNNYANVARTELDVKKLDRNAQKITETDALINAANSYSQLAIEAFGSIAPAR